MPIPCNEDITRKNIARYAMLAAPLAFAGAPFFIYAPDYYATEFGCSLSFLGIALLCVRVMDALHIPFVGVLSDRLGKKRIALMVGSVCVLAVSFAGLFVPPVRQYMGLWFFMMAMLVASTFSILSVNLNALGGIWSKDTHLKTIISSARETSGVIGLCVSVASFSVAMQFLDKRETFAGISIALAIWLLISMLAFIGCGRHIVAVSCNRQREEAERAQYADNVLRVPFLQFCIQKIAGSSGILRTNGRFFGTYFLVMLASSIPGASLVFFVRDFLQADAYLGLFLGLYFLSGAIGMQCIARFKGRGSKNFTWFIATLCQILCFALVLFLQPGDVFLYACICIISGMTAGADWVLPPSILGDDIHRFGDEKHATLYYGLLNFLVKIALAVGAAFTFLLLDIASFQAGKPNSPAALLVLKLIYGALPCGIKCVAFAVMKKR